MTTRNLTIYSDSSDNENDNHVNEKNYIELIFEKNKYISNSNLDSIKKYIKKNKHEIIELLYEKKLIKNKDIPLKLLMHIYVNYLNDDLEIQFL